MIVVFRILLLVILYVNFRGFITSVWEERAIFLLHITCNYVVSVRRVFHFLLSLVIRCVILSFLWHSLGIFI